MSEYEQDYKLELPIVDKVLYGDGWATGYMGGAPVIRMEGVSDISAIELYDENGALVAPEPAPAPGGEALAQLQLVVARLDLEAGRTAYAEALAASGALGAALQAELANAVVQAAGSISGKPGGGAAS